MAILIFFCAPFLALNIYLTARINKLDDKINSYKQTKEMKEVNLLEKSAKGINDILLNINKISENQIYWPDALEEIVKNIPAGVQIFSLEIVPVPAKTETLAASDAGFVIIGRARTRNDILALEKNLKASSDFKGIQSPLDNLLKRTDVEFKFTGTFILENFKAKERVNIED